MAPKFGCSFMKLTYVSNTIFQSNSISHKTIKTVSKKSFLKTNLMPPPYNSYKTILGRTLSVGLWMSLVDSKPNSTTIHK